MKTKTFKKIAKKVVKKSTPYAKAALQSTAIYGATQKKNVDVMKISNLRNSALKNVMGEKNYKKMIQGTKDTIGEKNYQRLDRADQVGLALGDMAFQASRGNLKGASRAQERAVEQAVGKRGLRAIHNKASDTIGKKNYDAIHHYGNRSHNVGLDLGSAAIAGEKGNYRQAGGYYLSGVRAAVGAEKVHQAKRGLRDKIGQKNYDILNNSYKAGNLGMDIGQTLGEMNQSYDAGKNKKMAMKSIKLAKQAKKAHDLFKAAHEQAGDHERYNNSTLSMEPRPLVVDTHAGRSNSSIKGGPANGVKKPTTVPTYFQPKTPLIGGSSRKPII